MNTPHRDFNKEAATWDEQPGRVRVANAIADTLIHQVTITSGMDALDFGCGTGLLTLHLQPLVHSITGVDSASGMLAILKEKIAASQLHNIQVHLCDLDKGDRLSGAYHLVTTSMTLHHIRDIASLLQQFHRILTDGGTLCLADLDEEGGLFHGDNTGVFHFGFDRRALQSELEKAGFTDVHDVTATEIEKTTADGVVRRFPVFLMIARKC